MNQSETTVLVIGAGPTGLTLACCLARQGVAFRIIEQQRKHARVARATAYQPRTLEVFDDLGVISQALDGTWTDMPFHMYLNGRLIEDSSRSAAALRRVPEIPYRTMARPLPTWRVEEVLRSRLSELGADIEFGTRLVTIEGQGAPGPIVAVLEQADSGVTERVRSTFLVGCDGAQSQVRELAGIGFEKIRDHDFAGYIAEMDIKGLDPTYARIWFADGGSVFLSPMPQTRNWQFQAPVVRNSDGSVVELERELAQRLFDERAGLPGVTIGEPTWKSVYVVRERLAQSYRRGNIFVAGDAAHIHSPAGGQGANTGIQDAYNLGWKLAHVVSGAAPAGLLDTYEEERRPVARDVLRSSGRSTDIIFSPGLAGRGVRRLLFGPLSKWLLERMSQLRLNYRYSSLSFSSRSRFGRRLSSGDRAPDGHVIVAHDGQRLRLFDLFRGSHFTILFLGCGAIIDSDALIRNFGQHVSCYAVTDVDVHCSDWGGPTLIDPHGRVRRAYGAARRPATAVVRPDGYLAYLQPPGRSDDLVRHLSRMLIAQD